MIEEPGLAHGADRDPRFFMVLSHPTEKDRLYGFNQSSSDSIYSTISDMGHFRIKHNSFSVVVVIA